MTERTGIGRWITGFEQIAEINPADRPLHSDQELMDWLKERKRHTEVRIRRISLEECSPWYYDPMSGRIQNPNGSFFSITGLEADYPDGSRISQPVILQPEIGYLGIICKRIRNVWHFLMQAKIEPGNINYVQISPTIQATRSNFTRRHGGREPAYLEYFLNMRQENILVDQIQSEQSSRFLGKRNRNVIIRTEEEIPELPTHRWMTLAQIRECMKHDNLVNMDTRTVLSCFPYVFMMDSISGYSPEFVRSMHAVRHADVTDAFLRMNNTKMFRAPHLRQTPLLSLKDWEYSGHRFHHRERWPFEVIFCSLNIEGREVSRWNQPLFAALGEATFGLLCREKEGRLEVLVSVKPEVGCFDTVELGPSVQAEYGLGYQHDTVAEAFFEARKHPEQVIMDVLMSEEGGRFYHEQNRNVLVRVPPDSPAFDPDRYIWMTLGSLNAMTMINNCLNIQLRNLLMLLSMQCNQQRNTQSGPGSNPRRSAHHPGGTER